MSTSLKKIEEQALNLDPEERAKLAEVMLESLSAPLSKIVDCTCHPYKNGIFSIPCILLNLIPRKALPI